MMVNINKHQGDVPSIDPTRLRYYVLRKPKGAVGAGGWHVEELETLPDEAWEQLAEMCNIAERVGDWPRVLTCALTVGLRKPGPESKGIRLRLLRIMP